MNKRKMGLWLTLTSALFLLSFSIPGKEAHAAKLIHGVQTTYQKKSATDDSYQDVATRYENTSFDTALNGKPPYPELIPSSTSPAKVIKTAYINLMETGIYLFTPNRGQVYVNDCVVSTAGQTAQPVYLEAGKIIKVKYDAPFTNIYQNSQLKWTTPTMPDDSVQFIPQEMTYTTPDLQGIDI